MGSAARITPRDLILAGALFGILFAIGLLLAATTWIGGTMHDRRAPTQAPKVVVSALGVISPTGYLPIQWLNVRLADVEIVPGEEGKLTTLRFTAESTTDRLTTRSSSFQAPIPQGRVAEAAVLAQRLMIGSGMRR
jgi:hypothetical protein